MLFIQIIIRLEMMAENALNYAIRTRDGIQKKAVITKKNLNVFQH